ncbi:MAG: right-handed parallel beta-helix repeat-containing protein [Bacteroidetes bacterium]|nr:right-handed parallel beta-helix repeat-containing protein [Bacteroidota bacterium]
MKQLSQYIKKIILISVLSIGLLNITSAQINQILEAEAATLQGTAQIATCTNASGGEMVKGLDNGSANSLKFQKMTIPQTGDYFVLCSYYSVSERSMTYRINEEAAQTKSVSATGGWCYQGGVPDDFIFKATLVEGENSLVFYDSPIIDKIVILTDTTARKASAIYISSSAGDDNKDGLTPETAFQTLAKVNSLELLPGDSLLFKSGDTFVGKLSVVNEGGSSEKPILVSNFSNGENPVLDGDGYLSTIHIVNSGYLHFSNLEIKNNGGEAKPGDSEVLRYGMYIENTFTDGTSFEHYRLNNLTFKNIYPTIEVTEDDNTGVNAHAIITSGSWGDDIHPTRFDDMTIEGCIFTRTARHATFFKAVNNLVIKNNLFEHVGGAGMVIGNGCTNILVENNVTNYTGSSIDNRMAGRGSGIWCFHSKNLTVQYNKLMHAKGIHDSYGMHIDIGNKNVVYQYNYSEDNEGGFVEILGENVNVGYRYNLSVGDGWRKRGNRFGQIFWLAGWSGDPQNPIGSDSIFVYNNSVYVRDSISPGIWIEEVSKNARIYNNIINVTNEFGPVMIKNDASFNDFDYNIWYGNIPVTDENGNAYRGSNALTSNPMYKDEIVVDSSGFILQSGSPALGAGKLIYNSGVSYTFDYYDNHGGLDFYRNSVSNTSPPNIGAYNGEGVGVNAFKGFKRDESFNLYPNPVRTDQSLNVKISSHVNARDLTIQVIDINGKIWMEKSYQHQNIISFSTKDLSRGSYMVKVKTDKYNETKQLLVF